MVKLNSQQTASYNLVVRTQTPLGAFPVRFNPLRIVPVNPVRYGGHLRLVNNGAVELEPMSVGRPVAALGQPLPRRQLDSAPAQ